MAYGSSAAAEAAPAPMVVSWMWGDSGTGFLGRGAATLNPLRWSRRMGLTEAIADLREVAGQSGRIKLSVSGESQRRKFANVWEALAFLQQAQRLEAQAAQPASSCGARCGASVVGGGTLTSLPVPVATQIFGAATSSNVAPGPTSAFASVPPTRTSLTQVPLASNVAAPIQTLVHQSATRLSADAGGGLPLQSLIVQTPVAALTRSLTAGSPRSVESMPTNTVVPSISRSKTVIAGSVCGPPIQSASVPLQTLLPTNSLTMGGCPSQAHAATSCPHVQTHVASPSAFGRSVSGVAAPVQTLVAAHLHTDSGGDTAVPSISIPVQTIVAPTSHAVRGGDAPVPCTSIPVQTMVAEHGNTATATSGTFSGTMAPVPCASIPVQTMVASTPHAMRGGDAPVPCASIPVQTVVAEHTSTVTASGSSFSGAMASVPCASIPVQTVVAEHPASTRGGDFCGGLPSALCVSIPLNPIPTHSLSLLDSNAPGQRADVPLKTMVPELPRPIASSGVLSSRAPVQTIIASA
eukprot:TRINITY_DN2683_c0_g1_i2.p1 TRINITY_DN2683_c0_g1~~TRINITY_DN2683_c0_g1_i2.p1  ORF type:complete len:522 (-),score=76.83 TRINITY_DN2683_c0_g1_i2:115-1680(-)